MRYNRYYSEKELLELGFRALGERVMISRDARIISPRSVSIGNNVLVEAFTIIDGDVSIGDHVQISANCELYAGEAAPIVIGDYCSLASFVSLYAQSDEYVLPCLNNPTVPKKYKNVHNQPIAVGKYVLIGTHSVVLPGVSLGEGCTFGANSLVNKTTPPGGQYVGSPCRRIRERDLEQLHRISAELEAEEQRKRERKKQRT